MVVDAHRRNSAGFRPRFGILTVSDSRTAADDRAGDLLAERVTASGGELAQRLLVRDQADQIAAAVRELLAAPGVDVVLVTGGTGLAPRDVTVEAVRPLLARELPGFGELFRMLSFAEVGPAAMLSRATAGVTDGRAIFLLPGSPAALALALDRLILPELGHLLTQARRTD